MKIELHEPFCSKWKFGYLRESPDKRKRIDLFNSNEDRTTISYSRYLMSVHVGRFLNDDEEVDHIDEDCTNDDINNLQILSTEEHRKKNSKSNSTGRTVTELKCEYCGKDFIRENRSIRKTNYISCSRRCSALINNATKNLKFSKQAP